MLLHLKRFVYEEKPIALTSTNKEEQGSVQASGEDKTRPRHQVEITFRKNRAPVVITEHLSLEKFIGEDSRTVSKNADSSSGNLYSIKSLVYHIGARASSGHYTADAIRICSKKRYKEDEEEESAQGGHAEKDSTAAKSEWVNFDDARTTVTTLSEILASERRRKTAYMILYTLE